MSDEFILQALQTEQGKKFFKNAFQLGAAKAADQFSPGSKGEMLGRMLAGLPIKEQNDRR